MTAEYVIITFSGFHHFITAEQEKKLRSLPMTATLELESGSINPKNIAEVVTSETYYQRYPDKRPRTEPTNFSRIPSPRPSSYSKERQKKKRRNRLEKMRDGFLKGVFHPDNMTEGQKVMYDQMEQALKKLEKGESPFIMGQDNN